MKRLKKILALALAMAMVLSMGISAFAADTSAHTITITNTDQNVEHKYEAYKVFEGTLDSTGTKLSNIGWANGVDSAKLLTELKGSTDASLLGTVKDPSNPDAAEETNTNVFKYCISAADVAAVIGKFQSTTGANENGGAADVIATIIANNLSQKAADFTADGTSYTANVTGDGYYFIKDTTTSLNNTTTGNSDTLSKYLLSVVKDTTIVAKDTGLNPDKKIVDGGNKVAADSASIGDTVTFEVKVKVPNTKKYVDHFIFKMSDKLPGGITFTGITSVVVGSKTLKDTAKNEVTFNDEYDGTEGYYTMTSPAATDGAYPHEAEGFDAVAAAGGQEIKITFNEFKKFVEKNDLIGQDVVITYTGVVNDDATYTATANENEVKFVYSNDPNHDYNGDEPGPGDTTGETPEDKTRTYTTSFKILKVDENNRPLAGATFELKGNALNRTVLTGTMFVEQAYEPKNGETVDATTKYWKLKDGSYSTTDPATVDANTKTKYENPDKVYYKVTYNKAELAAKSTDLVVTTGADGVAEFTGLNEGTYTLEELAAPTGFNKIAGTSSITISWDDPETIDPTSGADEAAQDALTAQKSQGGFALEATSFAANTTWDATGNQFVVTIENKSGTELPSTGGIGTTIFYVVGTILVIGAGVVLITRRRMDA